MIIKPEDIRKVRAIAKNIEDLQRIEPYIEETEKLDVIPVIGAELYKKIDDDSSEFNELLNGGYYNNDTCYFEGLISAIAYLSYSRFVINNAVNVTAFGVVFKQTQFSEKVDEATLFRHANETKKIGFEYLSQCYEYLKFKGYFDNCCKTKIIGKRKFKAIGR